MMHLSKHIWISILIGALFLSFGVGQGHAKDAETSSKKTISVTGNIKGKEVLIYKRGESGFPRLLKNCRVPCERKLNITEPFYLLISTSSRKFETYMRRNHDDAVFENDVYNFNVISGSSKEEAQKYFSSFASDHNNNPKRLACYDFSIDQLSDRPKACFKNTPILPAKTVRSGWCEISFIVKTDGSTDDVKSGECSEEIFRITSEEAAKLFRYYPRVKDGKIAPVRLKTKVKFALNNHRGKRVPAKGEKK